MEKKRVPSKFQHENIQGFLWTSHCYNFYFLVVKQLKGSERSVSVINSIEVHHQAQNKHIFPSQVFFHLLLEVIRLIEVGLSVGEREPAFPVREEFS